MAATIRLSQQHSCSFDHLVGGREQRRRYREAEHPGGLVIDHKLELASLHHRQVRGLCALEHAAGVEPKLTPRLVQVGSVAHESANFRILTSHIGRRQRVPCGQLDQLDAPAGKKGLLPTNKASGRARANGAKAASIAPLVSAWRIRISHPRARAAGSTSRNIVSVFVVSAGLTVTATRATPGISSRRSSSRLATSSVETKLMPVRLPPGRARLATRPSLTGSSATAKTMGIVVVAALAAKAETGPSAEVITVTCRRTNSPASAGSRSY